MNNIQKFYNAIAEKEAQGWYPNNLLLPLIKEFLSLLPKNPKVLDLGCGTGHESMRLHNEGATVVGIDFSSESIRIAKSKNKDINFFLMDYSKIDKEIGIYNGIFSSGSIIHLKKDELCELINRLRNNLEKNGIFLVVFQKGEGTRIHYPEINGERIERIVERYTKERMISIFKEAKYEFVKEGILFEDPNDIWMNLIFKKCET